jgi:cyclic pyranopterin phosphate synthase
MNKLVDDFNRHINYLRISITDRCNLRCAYCMPPEGIEHIGHDSVLSYEEIVHIARIAVEEGITKVRITGGEPLVRKGVVNLIHLLACIEGITDLSMTTNGILLADYAQPLVEAGLKRVNVSMDSLNSDLFREITRGGDLSSVWKGIEKAASVGLNPVKINVVAIQGFNEGEIADFARLTLEHNYHVRFIEFMPVGNGNGWEKGKYLSCSTIKSLLEKDYQLDPVTLNDQEINGPAQLYRIVGGSGVIGFINAISGHFCASCNRLRLTADGKLRPCLFSDQEIDIRESLRARSTDEELRTLLHQALSSKPKGHTISEPSFRKCARGMVAIGG